MRILKNKIAGMVMLLAGSTANAAESVDEAVSQVASAFAAANSVDSGASRVAVTTFVASDNRTTQFTKLVMIALTGKMVSSGKSAFKVIERAQLEAALGEIGLTESELFNPGAAKEFGNFLGVDQLVVGEITPLSDRVRIDSRLIDVETIETVEQASVWVPLTPTVSRQLDTDVVIQRASVMGGDDGPDPRNGVWRGTGQCGDAIFGIAIAVVVNPDDTLTAMQTYFPAQNGSRIESGVLTMQGNVDAASGEFTLRPDDWMYQPRGHEGLGFSGKFDTVRGEINANYSQEGCNALRLRKQ